MSDRTSSLYDGTMERTANGGVIRFERELEYGIRDVWDAITNPERLADWWLPFDAEITIDLRAGGEMTFVGKGEEPVELTCTILRVEPPMLLEHTHADPGSIMRVSRSLRRRAHRRGRSLGLRGLSETDPMDARLRLCREPLADARPRQFANHPTEWPARRSPPGYETPSANSSRCPPISPPSSTRRS